MSEEEKKDLGYRIDVEMEYEEFYRRQGKKDLSFGTNYAEMQEFHKRRRLELQKQYNELYNR